jgi:hypothetical protein
VRVDARKAELAACGIVERVICMAVDFAIEIGILAHIEGALRPE